MIPIRDENPTRTTPYVVYLLIAVNVVFFFLEITTGGGGSPGALSGLMMVPKEVTQGIDVPTNGQSLTPFWLTIFTSMFMHAGILHIGGNMLYLWIFGNNIEDALGHFRFFVFYMISGTVAALAHIFSDPTSVIPTLGASGAVAGVLGAYIVLYPHARILSLVFLGIFITTVDIPAIIVLGVWFVIQFLGLGSAGMQQGGGVAYWAHIGGFIAGFILIFLFGGTRLARPRRRRYSPELWYE